MKWKEIRSGGKRDKRKEEANMKRGEGIYKKGGGSMEEERREK